MAKNERFVKMFYPWSSESKQPHSFYIFYRCSNLTLPNRFQSNIRTKFRRIDPLVQVTKNILKNIRLKNVDKDKLGWDSPTSICFRAVSQWKMPSFNLGESPPCTMDNLFSKLGFMLAHDPHCLELVWIPYSKYCGDLNNKHLNNELWLFQYSNGGLVLRPPLLCKWCSEYRTKHKM